MRLGTNGEHLPLSTTEQETELVGSGDSQDNLEQYAEEINKAAELGIEPVQKSAPDDEDDEDGKKGEDKD